MANFAIAKAFTSDLEGGFWNDPSAGPTYAGITYKYYPSWEGFELIKKLAAGYKWNLKTIPRYTKFSDEALKAAVTAFYENRHWKSLVRGHLIKEQWTANLIYDFIVHKENAAIAVINKVAQVLRPGVEVREGSVSPDVINVFNALPASAYSRLRAARIQYYKDGKFSSSLKKEFINRVMKFPEAIASAAAVTRSPFKR